LALLGTAYRFDSEDTRNSPTLDLAQQLLEKGSKITVHDPYVKPTDQNLERRNLQGYFTNDLGEALASAEIAVLCTGHGVYGAGLGEIVGAGNRLKGIVDGANVYSRKDVEKLSLGYTGVGRGRRPPSEELVRFVEQSFRAVEHGVANEVAALADFLNGKCATTEFNMVTIDAVRELAGSCVTGCVIAEQKGDVEAPSFDGFTSRLAMCAENAAP
jgi:UDP-N-acetyl-D-mannosaminuronate dehydrogenase